MAATVATLQLQGVSGQYYGVSLYFAGSDAAGYIAPANLYGTATTTSPTDFTLPEPCRIVGWGAGPTTGIVTIDADGMPTPLNLNVASMIAAASAPRTWGQLAALKGGSRVRYRVRVLSAMSA